LDGTVLGQSRPDAANVAAVVNATTITEERGAIEEALRNNSSAAELPAAATKQGTLSKGEQR
jgi:hypothetical protein